MQVLELGITSKRNTTIKCTLTLPDQQKNLPLLLMAHGFCASRHENGTYVMLSERLAQQGIACIRCDFAGCNDSEESHQFNNLENDMDDIDTLLSYMKENYEIDEK